MLSYLGKLIFKQANRSAAMLQWFVIACLFFTSMVWAQENPALTKKDKLIAAYLFNFTKFIEWTESGQRDYRTEINICMQADSVILDFIRELVQGRDVGNKQLPVQIKLLNEQTRCDIAYFEKPAVQFPKNLHEVLIITQDISIYPRIAGISFYEEKKRLRFEVNMREINSLKLNIRSELLKLARIK